MAYWRVIADWLSTEPLGPTSMKCWSKYRNLSKKIYFSYITSPNWQPFYLGKILTRLVLKSEYSTETSSITWMRMPWLLASPRPQQPWYRPWSVNGSLFSTTKESNYIRGIVKYTDTFLFLLLLFWLFYEFSFTGVKPLSDHMHVLIVKGDVRSPHTVAQDTNTWDIPEVFGSPSHAHVSPYLDRTMQIGNRQWNMQYM